MNINTYSIFFMEKIYLGTLKKIIIPGSARIQVDFV